MSDIRAKIAAKCDKIKEMLLAKNASYGNSAMEPVRIFSSANNIEQLLVRIDDKLSRIARGTCGLGEDTLMDLVGYLVLLMIATEVTEDCFKEPNGLDRASEMVRKGSWWTIDPKKHHDALVNLDR